ncbi:Ribosome biogenesis regulatory protein [Aphelenchoides fujianensis]|nr:Ribosome biogenesis regulatory protein [Aphelenchoides fujianensis]
MVNAPAVQPTAVEKSVEPLVDAGNLLVLDREAYEFDKKPKVVPSDEELLAISRDNVQLLFNSVFKLPRSVVEDATCAELPDQIFGLPREKPVPVQAPMTRWEKFARSKGIGAKNNRDKKVWDEETETWKPRYGYNRGNDNTKDWLIEIPDQKDPNVDYFQERNDAKKERVAKNQLQHLKNVKRQMAEANQRNGFGNDGRAHNRSLNSARGANAIPLGVDVDPKERSTRELGYQMHHAKEATASKGKFQDKLKGEKTPKLGIKRKFEPNETSAKNEHSKHLAVLEKMAAKKPKIDQSRINAAAEHSRKSRDSDDDSDDGRKKKQKTPKKVKGTGRKAGFKPSKGGGGGGAKGRAGGASGGKKFGGKRGGAAAGGARKGGKAGGKGGGKGRK